jgi:hypothetical protein
MTTEQHENMINTIRGYHFAFKATGQDNYRITRDNLLNEFKAYLRGYNNVLQLKAV